MNCIVGLQLVAVAIRLRRRVVPAEVLGWAGTALITAGSARAGAVWLAASLLALCVVHTSLALVARARARAARQVIGALAGLGSWWAALAAGTWSTQSRVEVTALAWAVLALVLAAVAARSRLDRSWVLVWGTTAAVVSAGATAVVLLAPADEVRWPIVVALGCVAVGAAAGAAPVRASWLRDTSIGASLATLVVAWEVWRVPVPERIVALSVLTVGVSVATLLVRGRSRAWDRPLVDLGAGSAVLAVLLGLSGGSGEWALVPAIAAAAVQIATAGVILRRLSLQVLGPVLACIAWVLLMVDVGAQAPQWYTTAVGLALVAVVSLWRRDRRGQGGQGATPEIVALDLLGVAFLVGAPMVQAFTANVGHAFVATGVGLGVAMWGVGTRVRRRVAAGAVVILSSLAVTVAVPLVRVLPAWGGAGTWIALAVTGMGAVLGASMLERARDAVTVTRTRIGEWTAGWE
ncbi:hypothetical protein GALL_418020 [mine drainage metagenome]|uniref:Uncharacterized protein n=1 Tax=mine drainage metagenome TaxID=410659 RepID=A0A1J5PYF8_9ZZZZ